MMPFNHLGWVFKYLGPLIYPHAIRESLCSFLKPLSRHAAVLDLGSGTGVMSEFAHACRADLQFSAVDPAAGMLKFSAAYIETHQAYAELLPFDDAGFEAVLIGEALHHFQDVDHSVEEIVRVLQQEGRLFIYDFDPTTFMGKNLCRIEKLFGEPGNFFPPEVLRQKLESHGFSVSVSHFGYRYTIAAQLR
ncbi:MAG TPA: class I SAM-dependent methyltransferase [Sulfurovum sp.]|uniref:class I SAM-dependent methyltransferase n=1 Tax=Sulfurovum sp. TaxID=1969726 RepID=UPI002F94F320